MDSTTILALIIFALALTYMSVTTRAKILGIIAIVPCVVLAIHFANYSSVGYIALAFLNGYYAIKGGD